MTDESTAMKSNAERWSSILEKVSDRWNPLISSGLNQSAEELWSEDSGSTWRVSTEQHHARWMLDHVIARTPEQVTFHRFQVVATVSPTGEVVALQLDNGDEFLGLTDLSLYGISRGIRYLATQSPHRPREYQLSVSELTWAQPSAARGGIMSRVLKFLRRA